MDSSHFISQGTNDYDILDQEKKVPWDRIVDDSGSLTHFSCSWSFQELSALVFVNFLGGGG